MDWVVDDNVTEYVPLVDLVHHVVGGVRCDKMRWTDEKRARLRHMCDRKHWTITSWKECFAVDVRCGTCDAPDVKATDGAGRNIAVFCRDAKNYQKSTGYMRAPYDSMTNDPFHCDVLRLKYWCERHKNATVVLFYFSDESVHESVEGTTLASMAIPDVSTHVMRQAHSDRQFARIRPSERCSCQVCCTN